MRDSHKWPRFRIAIQMEVAAPCAEAAEQLADEYVTRANNDNGEDREVYTHPGIPLKLLPTDPAYVVQAQRTDAKESR